MNNNSDIDFKINDTIDSNTEENKVEFESNNISEIKKEAIQAGPDDSVIILNLTEENLKLNKKLEVINEKMYRIAADAQNSSKQNIIDIENAKKNAKKQVVKNLIPFLTSLQLSFPYYSDDDNSQKLLTQIKNSITKLNNDFESLNISFIIPQIGEDYNPSIMLPLSPTLDENPKVKNIASIGCIIDQTVVQPSSVLL